MKKWLRSLPCKLLGHHEQVTWVKRFHDKDLGDFYNCWRVRCRWCGEWWLIPPH